MPKIWTDVLRAPSAAALFVMAAITAAACGGDDAAPACPDEPGVLCTWIGTGEAGFDGDGNPLLESELYWPMNVAFLPSGAYVLDWNNHRVRQVEGGATLRTVIGTDFIGDGPEDFSDQAAPGADGTLCNLNHPTDLVGLPDGDVMLIAWHNHKFRRFDPETGRVTVVLGGPAGYDGDGGPMKQALVNQPVAATAAPDGTLFVMDQRNQVVRRIGPDGVISTVVGTPQTPGYAGDGGPPLLAQLNQPTGSNPPPGGELILDADGRLYLADTLNHRVRRVDFAADLIETVAGSGEAGFSGDGGPATAARINNPRGLALSPDGAELLISDELNNRVRAVDLADGSIRTVAGDGEPGFSGDGRPATDSSLFRPAGLSFDPEGRLVIADSYNHRVRRMRWAR